VGTGQFGRGRLWARFAVWRLREGWARLPIGVRLLWILLGVMLALTTPLMGLSYLFFRQSLETQQRLVQRQRLVAVANALDCELSALLRNVDNLSARTIQTADALAEPDPFTTQILYDATEHPIALLQVQPLPAEQVWQLGALQMVQRHLTLFGGMLVAIGVVVIVVMVALLQLQLRQVVSTIRRLASGDWDARVAYAARDEFGYLARAFNQMAHQLQQAFEAQEQQREEMEDTYYRPLSGAFGCRHAVSP